MGYIKLGGKAGRPAALALTAALAAGAVASTSFAADSAEGALRWRSLPTMGDMARAEPKKANQASIPGLVKLKCVLLEGGYLGDCTILSESPEGYGFGEAALTLKDKCRMAPKDSKGQSVAGREIVFRLSWGRRGMRKVH